MYHIDNDDGDDGDYDDDDKYNNNNYVFYPHITLLYIES